MLGIIKQDESVSMEYIDQRIHELVQLALFSEKETRIQELLEEKKQYQ